MNTLIAQKERLEGEVSVAKAKLARLRSSPQPDLRAITELTESITRNKQLIGMINNHLGCGHQPMWRAK
ncbi:MAG: hypothetical protein R3183_08565 [Oleiphilaceae bacterium]|nr:hypothetical protein [Oleiphilaceae bacterium]